LKGMNGRSEVKDPGMLEGSLVRRRLNTTTGRWRPPGKVVVEKEKIEEALKGPHLGGTHTTAPNVQLVDASQRGAPPNVGAADAASLRQPAAQGLAAQLAISISSSRHGSAPHAFLGGAAFWDSGAVGHSPSSGPYAQKVPRPAAVSDAGVPFRPASFVSAPTVGGTGAGAVIGDL